MNKSLKLKESITPVHKQQFDFKVPNRRDNLNNRSIITNQNEFMVNRYSIPRGLTTSRSTLND